MGRLLAATGLLVTVLATADPASGQLGIQGGFNLSSLVGSGVGTADTRTGLNAGIAYELFRVGPVSLGPEIHYAQRGAEAFEPARLAGGELTVVPVEIALEYVEIPVVARIRLPEVGPVLPFASGGPVFGWKLDCSVTLDASDGTVEPSCEDLLSREGLEAKVREYEQGLFLGGGVELPVLSGMGLLILEGRFVQGLSRLGEGAEGADVKNRAFSLTLGYAFGL